MSAGEGSKMFLPSFMFKEIFMRYERREAPSYFLHVCLMDQIHVSSVK